MPRSCPNPRRAPSRRRDEGRDDWNTSEETGGLDGGEVEITLSRTLYPGPGTYEEVRWREVQPRVGRRGP